MIKMFFAGVVLMFCFFSGGCGKNDGLVAIHGTVTVDNVPLKKGDISFAPVDGNGAMTDSQIVNGSYKARVAPGKIAVKIYSLEKVTDESMKTTEGMGGNVRIVSIIPAKYNDRTTLSIEVTPSNREHDFQLSVAE